MSEEEKEEATPPLPPRRLKPAQEEQPVHVALHVCGVSYQYGVGEWQRAAHNDNSHMLAELIICILRLLYVRTLSLLPVLCFAECEFCVNQAKATVYCEACVNFLCSECTSTIHQHGKHAWHKPVPLSHHTLDSAARVIQTLFVCHLHKRRLVRMAQRYIDRYFDSSRMAYYYHNTLTGTTSWRKPFCVGNAELFPLPSNEDCANRVVGLFRILLARRRAREVAKQYWTKIYDRRAQTYYYAYTGKSRLVPRSQWRKPKFFGSTDLKPLLTEDYAAIIIQRFWQHVLAKQFMQSIARVVLERHWDPTLEKYRFYNPNTQQYLPTDRPLTLGNQLWDPTNVMEWSQKEVVLFFRRIGLKEHVPAILNYRIDGHTLMALERKDFVSMGITKNMHLSKIEIMLERVFPSHRRQVDVTGTYAKRVYFRQFKHLYDSARVIQKAFRSFRIRSALDRHMVHARVRVAERRMMAAVKAKSKWWLEHPSVRSPPDDYTSKVSKTAGKYRDYASVHGPKKWIGSQWVTVNDGDG